jgi:hypothetical protein
MPRDRSDWNTSIGRGINTLLNREPGPSLTGSADTSASVLQTSNLAESTQSTSNSLAASQAIHRARERLQQLLAQSEDDEDIDCSKLTAGNDFLCTLTSCHSSRPCGVGLHWQNRTVLQPQTPGNPHSLSIVSCFG